MLRRLFIATLFFCAFSAAFAGTGLVEPTLKMSPQHDGKVRVAMKRRRSILCSGV
ncbi:hypothetical protein [Agrobacterium tumefaciens]|uniref:hypothetical protein n=1 Tax=Agrobacterium tumefaciens TaxID=358 RepID=UPI001F1D6168|nr:hypothetical protein [Agrobacterium tumefaciens]